jgi:hypothetical protein
MIAVVELMMQAVSISETSVNFYQTIRLKSPENSHPQMFWMFKLGLYTEPTCDLILKKF